MSERIMEAPPAFDEWAIVELMGHRRLGGRVLEVTMFGTAMCRVDVPDEAGGFTTQLYGGSAIYCLTPCSEDTARAVAARNRPEPVHRYELPAPTTIGEPLEGYADDDEDGCACPDENCPVHPL